MKQCSKCGEWKDRKRDFVWRTHHRNYGKRIYRYPMSHCKECGVKKSATYRVSLKASGKFDDAQARWESNRDRNHQNYMHRVRWRKLHGTTFDRAWKRYRHELFQRKNAGGVVGDFAAKPIAEFIDRFVVEIALNDIDNSLYLNGFIFSDSDKRNLRRWRNGVTKTVTLATLDRWATQYELPFWELEEVGRMGS